MSACGKKSENVSDYGNQNKATNSDAADDVSGYGSLRDKLGTDKINWQESINVNGINYKINLMYDVSEQENVPVYVAMPISDFDKKCISYATVVEKKRDQYYDLSFSKIKYYKWNE